MEGDFRAILEQKLAHGMVIEKQERSLIDGLFAKDELALGRLLIAKENYTKEDFPRLLDLAFGRELKLHNLDPKERYVLGKYSTILLADIFKMTEEMLQFQKTDNYKNLSDASKKQFDECLDMTTRYARWSLETFQYWTRSSLSLGLKGFLEALKQKFEVNYPNEKPGVEIRK
jgi:hypothetical protein